MGKAKVPPPQRQPGEFLPCRHPFLWEFMLSVAVSGRPGPAEAFQPICLSPAPPSAAAKRNQAKLRRLVQYILVRTAASVLLSEERR